MANDTAAFDKRTLRERCTAYVRSQIISGALAPGAHVIEVRLSEELGVSRGTLREALRPLQTEGLLVDDGRGHLLVRSMSAQEIADVFQVRAVLEVLAAETISARDDRHTVAEELRHAIEPLRGGVLTFEEQITVDLGFHELLCRRADNATLLRSWQQLVGQIEMMIIAAGPGRAVARMRYEEHVVIADAVATGDRDRVRQAITDHMDHFASQYLGDKLSAGNGVMRPVIP